MKKLILGVAMMIGFISFTTAQKVVAPATTKKVEKKVTQAKPVTPVATTVQPVVKKPVVTTVKPVTKPAVKTTTVVNTKTTTTQGVVLKKDGTPDKRFKTTVTKEKGPVKKDGTADMRYKANKKG